MYSVSSFEHLWSAQFNNSGSDNFSHIGRILSVGDGVITVSGLAKARSGEMVFFSNGDKGMVLNLERHAVKVVLFGSERDVTQGGLVFRTQKIVSIRVGSFLLGGVIDSIGNFINGKKPKYNIEDVDDISSRCQSPVVSVAWRSLKAIAFCWDRV